MKDSKQLSRSHSGQLAGSARKKAKKHAKQAHDMALRAEGKDPTQVRQQAQQELNVIIAQQAKKQQVMRPPPPSKNYDDWRYNY